MFQQTSSFSSKNNKGWEYSYRYQQQQNTTYYASQILSPLSIQKGTQ